MLVRRANFMKIHENNDFVLWVSYADLSLAEEEKLELLAVETGQRGVEYKMRRQRESRYVELRFCNL